MAKDNLHMMERLLDAKVDPVAEDVKEIKSMMNTYSERANSAHSRIDKYENRIYGLLVGAGVGGGGFGAALYKLFLGH